MCRNPPTLPDKQSRRQHAGREGWRPSWGSSSRAPPGRDGANEFQAMQSYARAREHPTDEADATLKCAKLVDEHSGVIAAPLRRATFWMRQHRTQVVGVNPGVVDVAIICPSSGRILSTSPKYSSPCHLWPKSVDSARIWPHVGQSWPSGPNLARAGLVFRGSATAHTCVLSLAPSTHQQYWRYCQTAEGSSPAACCERKCPPRTA